MKPPVEWSILHIKSMAGGCDKISPVAGTSISKPRMSRLLTHSSARGKVLCLKRMPLGLYGAHCASSDRMLLRHTWHFASFLRHFRRLAQSLWIVVNKVNEPFPQQNWKPTLHLCTKLPPDERIWRPVLFVKPAICSSLNLIYWRTRPWIGVLLSEGGCRIYPGPG